MITTMHTFLANLYTDNSWFLSILLWLWYCQELILPWHMSLVLNAKLRRTLSQNERLWHTLWTLVMCSCQLLASESYNFFSLRNKVTIKFVVLLITNFLHGTNLHRLVLLRIWRRISQVTSHGQLYLIYIKVLHLNIFDICHVLCLRSPCLPQ